MSTRNHPNEHSRIKEAYLEMATKARYRPYAPDDGMGNIQLTKEQLADRSQLEEEADNYATTFIREEDSLKVSMGISNFKTNRALVYAIEAARQMCAANDRLASKLLDMARAEMDSIGPLKNFGED